MIKEQLNILAKKKQKVFITVFDTPNLIIDKGTIIKLHDDDFYQVNKTLFRYDQIINVIYSQLTVILRYNTEIV